MSGARTQCNTALSEKLLIKMNIRFPDLQDHSISTLIVLGNTYSPTGDPNRSLEIRQQIQRSHVKPQIGQSWTCIDNQIMVRQIIDPKKWTKCVFSRVSKPMIGFIHAAKKFIVKLDGWRKRLLIMDINSMHDGLHDRWVLVKRSNLFFLHTAKD